VRTDTRASLDFQGLTGIASVSLIGGTPEAPPLKGIDGKPPRLVAESAGLQDLMQGAKNALARVESIAIKIDQLIGSNQKKIDEIVTNIGTFTKDLAGKDGRSLALEVTDTSKEITAAAKSVRELADQLDKSIGPTVKEYHLLAQDARRTVAEIGRVAREFERNPSQILFGRRTTPTETTTTNPTLFPSTTQPRPAAPRATATQKQKQKQQ
jgi:phospholipid/cholesterol/gamma-HCH transport system substrate-binding protein